MKKRYLPLQAVLQKRPEFLKIFQTQNILLYCKNRNTGKVKEISFTALEKNDPFFYSNSDSSWVYYFDRLNFENLLKDFAFSSESPEKRSTQKTTDHISSNMGKRYLELFEMDFRDRLEILKNDNVKLNSIISNKAYGKVDNIQTLVNVTRTSALSNRITLDELNNLPIEEARQVALSLKATTEELTNSLTQIISNESISDAVFSDLINKSDGTTVKHMLRVFFKAISFVDYLNEQIHHLSLNQKIRINFSSQYKNYYYRLFSNRAYEDISYDLVFKEGLLPIEHELYKAVTIGYMLHDIGKEANIDYYEGSANYNRKIIEAHADYGFNLIYSKTKYPIEAAIIIGYHHEYYGDPTGYGPFRTRFEQFLKKNGNHTFHYCISNTVAGVLKFEAYAFLPAKILEIVDIYDALTDKFRRYKKPFSPAEAIKIMKEDFLDKSLKIDPILFNIFINYLERTKEL